MSTSLHYVSRHLAAYLFSRQKGSALQVFLNKNLFTIHDTSPFVYKPVRFENVP